MQARARRHRQRRRSLRRRAPRAALPDARLAPRHGARRRQVRRHARRDHRHRMRQCLEFKKTRGCPSRSKSSASATRKACASAPRCSAAAPWPASSTRRSLKREGLRRARPWREALREFGLEPARPSRSSRARKATCSPTPSCTSSRARCSKAEGLPVGVVTAINGFSRLRVTLRGTAGHAGTVPMNLRRDALAGAAECVLAVERVAKGHAELVGTVGRIEAKPGAINVIPGEVMFTVDVRAPNDPLARAGRRDHPRLKSHVSARREPAERHREPAGLRRHRLRAAADGADGPRGGGRGPSRAPPAFGRGPRRHGARRDHRHLHAVRALQGRHQPQPARIDHAEDAAVGARVLERFISSFT